MAGRKPKYQPEKMQVGDKVQLHGAAKKYADQYVYAFRKKCPSKSFKKKTESGKIFIERV
jgi:hypothetical protein